MRIYRESVKQVLWHHFSKNRTKFKEQLHRRVNQLLGFGSSPGNTNRPLTGGSFHTWIHCRLTQQWQVTMGESFTRTNHGDWNTKRCEWHLLNAELTGIRWAVEAAKIQWMAPIPLGTMLYMKGDQKSAWGLEVKSRRTMGNPQSFSFLVSRLYENVSIVSMFVMFSAVGVGWGGGGQYDQTWTLLTTPVLFENRLKISVRKANGHEARLLWVAAFSPACFLPWSPPPPPTQSLPRFLRMVCSHRGLCVSITCFRGTRCEVAWHRFAEDFLQGGPTGPGLPDPSG